MQLSCVLYKNYFLSLQINNLLTLFLYAKINFSYQEKMMRRVNPIFHIKKYYFIRLNGCRTDTTVRLAHPGSTMTDQCGIGDCDGTSGCSSAGEYAL
jgi:hypothetical protein